MFARFRGSQAAPAAPGKRTNGSNRNAVNNAQTKLSTALNNIAYHHVQKYANAIKANAKANAAAVKAVNAANANPTPAKTNAAAAALRNAANAGAAVTAAAPAAAAAAGHAAAVNGNGAQPTAANANAALQAEAAATNAVARNAAALTNFNARIEAANNRGKLTQIEVNLQAYANKYGIPLNRPNVKQRLNAVNTKRNRNSLLISHPINSKNQ